MATSFPCLQCLDYFQYADVEGGKVRASLFVFIYCKKKNLEVEMTSEQGEAIAVSSLKLPALSVLHLRSISLADILPVHMNS